MQSYELFERIFFLRFPIPGSRIENNWVLKFSQSFERSCNFWGGFYYFFVRYFISVSALPIDVSVKICSYVIFLQPSGRKGYRGHGLDLIEKT